MKKLKNFKILFCFGILFLTIPFLSPDVFALDPAKDLNEYLIRVWTSRSGLPQNTINALIQTHDGYIWVGTPSGLVRFDGVRFEVLTRLNTPALKNDGILSLYEDRENGLWVGTDGGGLCSYRKGIWKSYNTEDGLSNNHVRAITSDLRGQLWVGTEYGLNRLDMDGFRVFTTRDGLYDNIITALDVDHWGHLWIGTLRGGLAKLKEGVIRVYEYDDGLINMAVNAVSTDHMGHIWIGTMAGLYTLRQGEEMARSVAGTAYTPITSIVEDNRGALWVGTMADGLKRIWDGSMAGYSGEDGFPDDFVHGFLNDEDGNIWVGTDTGGLVQLKEAKVRTITRENGLPENGVSTILQDHEGTVWIGMRRSGLCRMRDDRVIKIIDSESDLSGNRISVLFEDRSGCLWIGTEGGGINRLKNGTMNQLTTRQGLSSDNITALLQDSLDAVWIGTDKGLNRIQNGRIDIYDGQIGLAQSSIRVLLKGREDGLFIGTRGGVFELVNGSFIKLNSENQDSDFDVFSLYEDSDGVLWIGTNGIGLKRWFQGEMKTCTTQDGLPDNYILSITEDDIGYLWMSSYNGVFRIFRDELNEYFENKIARVMPACYDESDGMGSRQCRGGSQPSFCKTKSGQLYYPTVTGISVFDPMNMVDKLDPPKVIIEDLLVDDVSILSEEKIAIPYGCDRMEIRFTAFDYEAPEKLRFRYQLVGYDTGFIDVNSNDKCIAEYLNPDPGRYRFIVRAANNDGVWSEEEATLEFEVLLPLYGKPIFFIISILVFLSVAGTVILTRHKKKIKKRLEKYKTSALDPERADEIVPKLLEFMEGEKVFLNPDLTLKELSQRLRIHYNHLSRIINERFGLSYNDFINQYRIEEAKRRLSDSAFKGKTVLEILYDTGFYSKSVFNTAFKKFTGMTPTEYRKRHSNSS